MTSPGDKGSLDPIEEYLQKKNSRENLDRFIPNRSAMDFDYARSLLNGGKKWKKKSAVMSPSSEAYQKLLVEALDMNRSRILAFKNKPWTRVELIPQSWLSPASYQSKPTKTCRSIPKTCEKTLDAPNMVDDYYLNLLDWGANNVVAVALSETVYLWNASNGSITELVTFNNEEGPVTSVSWAPDGQHIAIGLRNSDVQLWDFSAQRQLRTLRGGHQLRVGSLTWNNHILTTGGMDCKITNNDVRIRSHIVGTYRGHRQEVCGLKWSPSGKQLASGGKDNLLYLWDRSRASLSSGTQWVHKIEAHTAAVKALAWCPFQGNLLASGGSDQCIKFWNTCTGVCLDSVDTGSEVCALLWSKRERELLSSHGLTKNELILWRYPSLAKMAVLTGHTSRVLFLAQSPDGCTVASAAADERLMFWQVFGIPEVAKPAPKTSLEPFSHCHGYLLSQHWRSILLELQVDIQMGDCRLETTRHVWMIAVTLPGTGHIGCWARDEFMGDHLMDEEEVLVAGEDLEPEVNRLLL